MDEDYANGIDLRIFLLYRCLLCDFDKIAFTYSLATRGYDFDKVAFTYSLATRGYLFNFIEA